MAGSGLQGGELHVAGGTVVVPHPAAPVAETAPVAEQILAWCLPLLGRLVTVDTPHIRRPTTSPPVLKPAGDVKHAYRGAVSKNVGPATATQKRARR